MRIVVRSIARGLGVHRGTINVVVTQSDWRRSSHLENWRGLRIPTLSNASVVCGRAGWRREVRGRYSDTHAHQAKKDPQMSFGQNIS